MSSLRRLGLSLESWLSLYLVGFTVRQLSSVGENIDLLFDRGEAGFILDKIKIKDKQKALWLEFLAGQGKVSRQIDDCLHWLETNEANHIISCQDVRYPLLLLETNSPPLLLFAAGQIEHLNRPMLAMVGSRNPTATGIDNAHNFSKEIASRNIIVASGLALGIDAACHKGALSGGSTVAVLGTGIDVVYPRRNANLAKEICEKGVIVSEFMLGAAPLARHFPRRNRIISGLSLGVLVVEAARQSGSLITARLALDANREVFAIPGSIHNPLARGCHQLIRDGATLVESVFDILEQIAPGVRAEPTSGQDIDFPDANIGSLSQDARLVLASVGFEPTPIDVVTERASLNVSLVNSLLIELELEGHVRPVSGGYARG